MDCQTDTYRVKNKRGNHLWDVKNKGVEVLIIIHSFVTLIDISHHCPPLPIVRLLASQAHNSALTSAEYCVI